MKSDKSSNTHDTNRKVFHPEDHEAMKEQAKLQGSNSDGREGSYKEKEETGEEKSEQDVSSMKKDITGKADQNDVRKEFEIRSEKEEGMEKKKGKDPIAESQEKEKGSGESEGTGWRKSYKGDAELVT